ncbi:Arylsulfatase [Rubripirellula lacrimiformis]|uniref:Arylsulfatase n=1 Tax=Rubripirellula lacrimiformis TaxID=1930273 RepID=A0A517N4X6_9BACT|nr:Arylsulfatase [Rubripirellula lacrimiformis]
MHKAIFSTLAMMGLWLSPAVAVAEADKPNVLFIAVDDLNDWIGCLGGHPQAKTPNIDRLAASGVLFTNAHCPAPACNPSRSAIMTGISPHVSGLYDNRSSSRRLAKSRKIRCGDLLACRDWMKP